jgi:hypothetical protein
MALGKARARNPDDPGKCCSAKSTSDDRDRSETARWFPQVFGLRTMIRQNHSTKHGELFPMLVGARQHSDVAVIQ